MRNLRIIITGVTGMVGEGVLYECLLSPDVEKVLVITRRPSGIAHPKLSEIVHDDFYAWDSIKTSLAGYNACFFCLGTTSVGKTKAVFEHMTYDLTMGFAQTLASINADIQFCYVSGAGTDSSENGRSHWARVKGRTENDLQKIGFANTWLFRPGIMKPTQGLKNTHRFYRYFSWLFPVMDKFFPSAISTLAQLGRAMIQVSVNGYPKPVLEVTDIRKSDCFQKAGKSSTIYFCIVDCFSTLKFLFPKSTFSFAA